VTTAEQGWFSVKLIEIEPELVWPGRRAAKAYLPDITGLAGFALR